jgi:hypothetical protein
MSPVPTEWVDVADAHQFSIPIAEVSPDEVAEAAIVGMLEGKRSVVPGSCRTSSRLPAGSREEVCCFRRCDSLAPRAGGRPLHRHRRFMLARGSQIEVWVSGLRVQDDH